MSNGYSETGIFTDGSNGIHEYILGAILLATVGSSWASTYVPKRFFQFVLKSISRLVKILHRVYSLDMPWDDKN